MPEKAQRIVVLHDYSEKLGGASYLVGVLVRRLRDMGHRVTFITGDDGSAFDEPDIELVTIGSKPLLEKSKLKALTTGLYNPETNRVVRRWIKENDTPETVYHLHGWSKILSPAVFRGLAHVKERVVLHAHDYFLTCPNGGYYNFQENRDCLLTPLSMACLASNCDKTSRTQKIWRVGREYLRRTLDGLGGSPARVLTLHPGMIPPLERGGISSDLLHAVRNPVMPFSQERIEAEKNRKIVFIGRISAEKGADLAARAALRAAVPIEFIGAGAEVEAIKAINPQASFTGWLDSAQVAEAMRAARLVVMPSRWSEPFGLVALEAIGSGIPAIVSRTALLGPEIEQNGFGYSIDPGNVDAFADLLKQVGEDDEAIAQMSRAGHQGYLSLCNSPDGWVAQILDHYDQTLQAAAGQRA